MLTFRLLPLLAVACLPLDMGTARAQTLPDHARLDRVLAAHLHGGRVDYAGLAADRGELELYLEELARTSPKDLELVERDVRLAFWINAYNACVLHLVVTHYPIERRPGAAGLAHRLAGVPTNSIRQIPETWTRPFCRVAQRDRSLDGIEHGIIRPMGEPRIHFAINCGARSCPVLAPAAYRGELLDAQLDEAVRRFVAAPDQYEFAPGEPPMLRVGKILEWYKEDFGGTSGVVAFLHRYAPPEHAAALEPGRVRVEYLDYDWTLNDTTVAGPTR